MLLLLSPSRWNVEVSDDGSGSVISVAEDVENLTLNEIQNEDTALSQEDPEVRSTQGDRLRKLTRAIAQRKQRGDRYEPGFD